MNFAGNAAAVSMCIIINKGDSIYLAIKPLKNRGYYVIIG